MIYIPVSCLKPGMVLARNLPSNYLGVTLLNKNEKFTAKIIDKLIKLRISGVYIKNELTNDVDLKDIISHEQRNKLIMGIKKQFDNFARSAVISKDSVNSFYAMSSDIVSAVLDSDEVLYNMIDIKVYDTYTYSHSMVVALLSVLIGRSMGLCQKKLQDLAMCGLMHDIGKVDIPIEIINKNGKLTDEEYTVVKNHPTLAIERLSASPLVSFRILKGIESHHERFDGSGYPLGSKGEDIPLYGRILAIADVYDALTSKRSYRDPWSSADALDYMIALADKHFDIDIMQYFLKIIAAYPVGSIVKLSNGYIGIVISNSPCSAIRPTVRIVEPFAFRGTNIDLANDRRFLSITVIKTIHDASNYLRDMPTDI